MLLRAPSRAPRSSGWPWLGAGSSGLDDREHVAEPHSSGTLGTAGGPAGFVGEMPRSPGHVFYGKLQAVLIAAGFDAFVERQCAKEYAPRRGRPSLPLLPHAADRLFRRHRQRAWPGMALHGQAFAASVGRTTRQTGYARRQNRFQDQSQAMPKSSAPPISDTATPAMATRPPLWTFAIVRLPQNPMAGSLKTHLLYIDFT
jgi:hypothetical protein